MTWPPNVNSVAYYVCQHPQFSLWDLSDRYRHLWPDTNKPRTQYLLLVPIGHRHCCSVISPKTNSNGHCKGTKGTRQMRGRATAVRHPRPVKLTRQWGNAASQPAMTAGTIPHHLETAKPSSLPSVGRGCPTKTTSRIPSLARHTPAWANGFERRLAAPG